MIRPLLTATLLACAASSARAQQAPPPEWHGWLAEVEACAGLRLPYPLDSLRVLAVPDTAFLAEGRVVIGYAYPAARVVAVVRDSLLVRPLVQHELLHLLLEHPGHLDPRFGTCARKYGT